MSEGIKKNVRRRYGQIARRASSRNGCCDDTASCCGLGYAEEDLQGLPSELVSMSLGSGNPISRADLKLGETVLDLGSGAGLDALIAARRVGESGKVYGLDMTEDMLDLADKYRQESGIGNVEFIKGEMEQVPLSDESVDTIMSNCVVNLSPDKARVFSECFRILKPGGRVAISDLTWRDQVPAEVRENTDLWCSCVGGALTEDEYVDLLYRAGFTEVHLERTGAWSTSMMSCCTGSRGTSSVNSAFVTARKPS